VTRPVPENPARGAGARWYVVGGVLVRQALRALAQRKGRTALTAFSIAIGIAAVVWVVAIGKAGARRAEAQLAQLGKGLVWVTAGSRNIGGVRTGSHGAVTLTAEDAEAILAEVPRIQSVSLCIGTSVMVVAPNGNWTTLARGISVSFLDMFSPQETTCHPCAWSEVPPMFPLAPRDPAFSGSPPMPTPPKSSLLSSQSLRPVKSSESSAPAAPRRALRVVVGSAPKRTCS